MANYKMNTFNYNQNPTNQSENSYQSNTFIFNKCMNDDMNDVHNQSVLDQSMFSTENEHIQLNKQENPNATFLYRQQNEHFERGIVLLQTKKIPQYSFINGHIPYGYFDNGCEYYQNQTNFQLNYNESSFRPPQNSHKIPQKRQYSNQNSNQNNYFHNYRKRTWWKQNQFRPRSPFIRKNSSSSQKNVLPSSQLDCNNNSIKKQQKYKQKIFCQNNQNTSQKIRTQIERMVQKTHQSSQIQGDSNKFKEINAELQQEKIFLPNFEQKHMKQTVLENKNNSQDYLSDQKLEQQKEEVKQKQQIALDRSQIMTQRKIDQQSQSEMVNKQQQNAEFLQAFNKNKSIQYDTNNAPTLTNQQSSLEGDYKKKNQTISLKQIPSQIKYNAYGKMQQNVQFLQFPKYSYQTHESKNHKQHSPTIYNEQLNEHNIEQEKKKSKKRIYDSRHDGNEDIRKQFTKQFTQMNKKSPLQLKIQQPIINCLNCLSENSKNMETEQSLNLKNQHTCSQQQLGSIECINENSNIKKQQVNVNQTQQFIILPVKTELSSSEKVQECANKKVINQQESSIEESFGTFQMIKTKSISYAFKKNRRRDQRLIEEQLQSEDQRKKFLSSIKPSIDYLARMKRRQKKYQMNLEIKKVEAIQNIIIHSFKFRNTKIKTKSRQLQPNNINQFRLQELNRKYSISKNSNYNSLTTWEFCIFQIENGEVSNQDFTILMVSAKCKPCKKNCDGELDDISFRKICQCAQIVQFEISKIEIKEISEKINEKII